MSTPKITLYYDVVSPYSWLGFEVLNRYKSIWKADIQFIPFLLGGIMNASQNSPPATNKFKAKYMTRDLIRQAEMFQVPLTRFPSKFPDSSTKAQRVLTAIRRTQPDLLIASSQALWKCYWGEGRALSEDDNLVAYLTPVVGADEATRYVAVSANDPEIKQELINATQQAVDTGAFGAPWIVIDGLKGKYKRECLFGSDRFEQVAFSINQPYLGPVPTKSKL